MKKKIIIIASIITILDQISKILIKSMFNVGDSLKIIKNFFYIKYIKNYGASWGVLSGYRLFLIIVGLLAVIIVFSYIKELKNNKINTLGYSFLLGGIIGNLIDRIIYGYVIDFLDFIIFGYDYPIFNIADTFIVLGGVFIIISMIKGDSNEISSKRKK